MNVLFFCTVSIFLRLLHDLLQICTSIPDKKDTKWYLYNRTHSKHDVNRRNIMQPIQGKGEDKSYLL